jgi:pimeloyl-ACP methyl ester carboxylesterase
VNQIVILFRAHRRAPLHSIIVSLLFSFVIGTTTALADDQFPVPRFEPDTCSFGEVVRIECGWVVVPEDYAQPDGKTIRLAVAILKTSNRNPAPDPIVYLSGGPGSGVVEFAPLQSTLMVDLLFNRDLILFDQRGSGLSQPALDCSELEADMLQQSEMSEAEKLQPIVDCHARLEKEGVNLAAYNTVNNAADVESLRTALGYEQINLLGGSYGTRLALIVMRNHPDGIRSVILDSTLPAQQNTFVRIGENFDHTLQTLQEGCNADLLCRAFYPDIRGSYYKLFDQLNQSPISFEVKNPLTQEFQTAYLDGYRLADMVFMGLYSRESIQRVPAALYSTLNGDLTILKDAAQPPPQRGSMLSFGMFFSVMCADSTANISKEQIIGTAANYPEPIAMRQSVLGEYGFGACALWNVPPIENNSDPVISDIPTLVLAGQYDPITPTSWGKQAAETLSHSFFIEFPGVGHGVTNTPCPMGFAAAFIDDPTQQPHLDCVENMRSLQFVIGADRIRPVALIALLLIGGVALWSIGNGAATMRRQPGQIAWRAARRSMGWIPVIVTGLAVLAFLIPEQTPGAMPWSERARVIETLIPLAIGIQAALLFSPDDEPALEVLLACPRKISWVLLERLAVVLTAQTGIALVGIALTLSLVKDADVPLTLLRWIPPALFFSGVAVYATLKSRVMAFGMVIAGLTWFAFSVFGESLLPGQPTLWPLNYVLPFLWPIHPYLQPDSLTIGDYWLNRAFVTAVGIGLLILGIYQLRDEEYVLLGTRGIKKQKEA